MEKYILTIKKVKELLKNVNFVKQKDILILRLFLALNVIVEEEYGLSKENVEYQRLVMDVKEKDIILEIR